MAIYKIINKGAKNASNKEMALNIHGSNFASLSENQDVTLWEFEDSREQNWEISSLSNGVFIKSYFDNTFALNPWRSGTNWKCDVLPYASNQYDAKVDIIPYGSYYKIRLTNYNTRYLTAGGSADGSSVFWSETDYGDYQLWEIIDPDSTGGNSGNISYDSCHILGFKGHGSCLNIYTSTTASNGSPISMYSWDNHNDQIWTLRQLGVNDYVLESKHTGLYLGYTGATYEGYKSCNITNNINNAHIVAEPVDQSRNIYRFKMNINGSYHYLTATAGTTGSRLVWFNGIRNSDQMWMFVSGTSHPYSHPSPTYNFAWPASNGALVTDGYNGLWRLYTTLPNVTRNHAGIDTQAGTNKCYSMFAGKVIEVQKTLSSNRGRYVKVRSNDNQYVALYQHLASTQLDVDDDVSKGSEIGVIGGTGTAEDTYDVHLHFEINNGTEDPLIYF